MSFYKVNPVKIDWESKDSVVFLNERHGKKTFFVSCIPRLPSLKSHIWLATSGRACHKWVALSRKALLTSARAVNQHICATSRDRWGFCLPLFHVGGLSILARAHLSRSFCVSYGKKWSAKSFVDFLTEYKITLSSLVPTQVYDIVKAGQSCPSSVRTVVVGGENLNEALYLSAVNLGWPLLPSYGLTEAASQVATADISSLNKKEMPLMKVLSHIQLKIVRGEIAIQSESLLTGFVPLSSDSFSEFQDPKENNWYFTGDQGVLKSSFLRIENSNQIKILGEKVNLKNLEEELMNILLKEPVSGKCVLLPVPEEREGFQMALVSDVFDRSVLSRVIQRFNEKVSPFERIRKVYFLPLLPLTGISKISQSALLEKLGFFSKKPA